MTQEALKEPNTESQLITASIVGSRIIVWDPEQGSELYAEAFYGKPLGIRKPKSPHFTVPLELSFLEAKYLQKKKRILVFNPKTGENLDGEALTRIAHGYYEMFDDLYIVYSDLREHGYVVRPGLKFGCDMAVYEQGPGIDHSLFIVEVVANSDEISAIEVVRAGRLATSVRKRFVLATPTESGKVKFFTFSWMKP